MAQGRQTLVWDVDATRAQRVADDMGASLAGSLEEALDADLLVTVTPGNDVLIGAGTLRAGPARQSDGRRRTRESRDRSAEIERARVFCDDWEQASHGGELAAAFEAGSSARRM